MQRKTSHVLESLELLTSMFRNAPILRGVLSGMTLSIQSLEDALWQISDSHLFANLQGKQVDLVGSIVNEERKGRSDFEYKKHILLRLFIQRSNGRPDDILHVLAQLKPNALFFENGGGEFEVHCFFSVEETMHALHRAIAEVKPAGVRAVVFHTSNASTDTLLFSNSYGGEGVGGFADAGGSGNQCTLQSVAEPLL